jgi:16S rRNA (guanine966-N2)-methyltransferase
VCLDLFAGSGVLGFEALSRGAAAVTLVENNRAAFASLQANARQLAATGARLEKIDALEFLARDKRRYDVIFLDPPFRHSLPARLFAQLDKHLAARGRVYYESDEAFKDQPGWTVVRQARAGNVHFHLLERAPA